MCQYIAYIPLLLLLCKQPLNSTVTVQITHGTVTYPAIGNRFAMGWIPPTTTFYYGQRSKCADLH